MSSRRRNPNLGARNRWLVLAAAFLGLLLVLAAGVSPAEASVSTSFPDLAFNDDFESGALASWTGVQGTGTALVSAAAAHDGSHGVRLANALGQWTVMSTMLPADAKDSSTRFSVRVNPASGLEEIAQARDAGSSARMWELMYDGGNQRFYFFPYRSTGPVEIDTDPGSAPSGQWLQVEVRYTAASGGGAQISINGQTKAAWGVSGDFSRTSAGRATTRSTG